MSNVNNTHDCVQMTVPSTVGAQTISITSDAVVLDDSSTTKKLKRFNYLRSYAYIIMKAGYDKKAHKSGYGKMERGLRKSGLPLSRKFVIPSSRCTKNRA